MMLQMGAWMRVIREDCDVEEVWRVFLGRGEKRLHRVLFGGIYMRECDWWKLG